MDAYRTEVKAIMSVSRKQLKSNLKRTKNLDRSVYKYHTTGVVYLFFLVCVDTLELGHVDSP